LAYFEELHTAWILPERKERCKHEGKILSLVSAKITGSAGRPLASRCLDRMPSFMGLGQRVRRYSLKEEQLSDYKFVRWSYIDAGVLGLSNPPKLHSFNFHVGSKAFSPIFNRSLIEKSKKLAHRILN